MPGKSGETAIDKNMQSLIPCVNKLQAIFSQLKFSPVDLPEVVAIGGQSAGKTSVIENLVGKDFLPRGSGIVTRRPLVLQLVHTEAGTSEYGEFAHLEGRRFDDFKQISQEIENDTQKVCGGSKGVNMQPIILKIFSPNVLDLTLVDTPGMTKVPVQGQPADIGDQIKNMVCHYVSRPNRMILAVTAANQDLANSDALQLAKQVPGTCKNN
jgi:hypothetical protein